MPIVNPVVYPECAVAIEPDLSFHDIPALVWQINTGSCVFVNKPWIDATGLDERGARGDGWLSVFHKDELSAVRAMIDAPSARGRFRIRSVNGSYATYQISARSTSEKTVFLANEIIPFSEPDLLDPVRSPELRLTLEEMPTMIWSTTPDGFMDYANNHLLEYFNLSWEEAEGWGWRAAVHPDEWPAQERHWRGLIERPATGVYEMRVGSPERGYRWAITYGSPLFDAQGNLARWYGTVIDTENLHRTEDALKLSESYLSQSQSIARIGSIGFDPGWTSPFWSQEVFKLLGVDETVAPSRGTILSRVHPEDTAQVTQFLDTAHELPAEMSLETRIVLDGGEVRSLKWLAKLSSSMNRPFYVSVLQDITQELEVSERVRRLEADLSNVSRVAIMGELAASIAHELNQPLAAILATAGASIRWLDRPDGGVERARSNLVTIVDQAQRASEVVQRVRSLFQQQSQIAELINLPSIWEEVVPLVEHLTKRLRAKLSIEIEDRLPDVVGDKVQIQQVLLNLMVNALQAMETAPMRSLTATMATGASSVVVEISDTGPGIDVSPIEKIFESFCSTKPTGLGLGLSISRTIVERHGGTISARNRESGGATFRVELPTLS